MKYRSGMILLFALGIQMQNASAFDLFKSTDNQESCIIDGLQDIHNRESAIAVVRKCRRDFRPHYIAKPSNALGHTGDWLECVAKYAGQSKNESVASQIRRACYRIHHPPPSLFDDLK